MKLRRRSRRRATRTLFGAVALLAGLEPAYASQAIWIATAGGAWSDVLNWQNSFAPGANDDAAFFGDQVQSVSGVSSCNAISLFDLSTLTPFSGSPALNSLHMDNSNIQTGGTWTSKYLGLTNSTLKIAGGTFTASETLEFVNNGTILVTGGTFAVKNAPAGNNGAFIVNGGRLELLGGATISPPRKGLVVTNGARVFSNANDYPSLNYQNGAGTVTISNGAVWDAANMVFDTGTINISSGARVNAFAQWVGHSGHGSYVTVDGGSLNVTSYTNIGESNYGELLIKGGSNVTTNYLDLATGSGGGSSGKLAVMGAGTRFTSSQYWLVGRDSGQGTVEVSHGAQMTAGFLTAGLSSNSGTHFTVDGAGSQLNVEGANLGDAGLADLAITNGGRFETGFFETRNQAFASGAGTVDVLVDGAGSEFKLRNFQAMVVGWAGPTNFTVSNGASVSTQEGIVSMAARAGGDGTITVTGSGSNFTGNCLWRVGENGKGRLDVLNGGTVHTGSLHVSEFAGSNGSVLVDGAGSKLESANDVHIGMAANGTITVQNGGKFIPGSLVLGESSGFTGALTITGSASTLDLSNLSSIHLGESNSGAGVMQVLAGAKVESSSATNNINLGWDTGTSGSLTISGDGSAWNGSQSNFLVGDTGTGTLLLSDGATLDALSADVGHDSGSNGAVSLSAAPNTPKPQLTSSVLVVGHGGTGQMNVNTGTVNTEGVTVGMDAGSVGSLSFSGSTTAWNHGQALVQIGYSGKGTLLLDDHATGTLGSGLSGLNIGENTGGEGTLHLANGSNLVGDDEVAILGKNGSGTILIDSGASMTLSQFKLGMTAEQGSVAEGDGHIVVTGNDSKLTVKLQGAQAFQAPNVIGNGGSGTFKVLLNASAEIEGAIVVGAANDGSGLIQVDSSTLKITTDDPPNFTSNIVGLNGSGTVDIKSFGRLTINTGLDVGAGSGNGTLKVRGPSAQADIAGPVTIGSVGEGALFVGGGGRLNATELIVGDEDGSSGDVTLEGPSHIDLSSHRFIVGSEGAGSFTIQDSATFDIPSEFHLGVSDGSSGILTVKDPGSQLHCLGGRKIVVGEDGEGIIHIDDGATMDSDGSGVVFQLARGATSDSSGRVSGVGARWDALSGDFEIGVAGKAAMRAERGGVIKNLTTTIGRDAGSDGLFSLLDSGSLLDSPSIVAGKSGKGTMNVSTGAKLKTEGVTVGMNAGANGLLAVQGSGTTWEHGQARVQIGYEGKGKLWLFDHSVSTLGSGQSGTVFGDHATGVGTGEISGGASVVGTDEVVVIGNQGKGDVLIADSGTAQINQFTIGSATGGAGSLTLTGTGSKLTANLQGADPFQTPDVVGKSGAGTMVITDNAIADITGALVIGQSSGGMGNVVVRAAQLKLTTNDPASVVSNRIGVDGLGSLLVQSGGTLSINGSLVVGGGTGQGILWVTGANSTANITKSLSVGESGAGSLAVDSSGKLTCDKLIIGNLAGGIGAVTLSDAAVLDPATTTIVGAAGAGSLTIDAGATFTPRQSLLIGTGSGTGIVTVTGANSKLHQLSGGSIMVGQTGRGTLSILGGASVLTDSGASALNFGGAAAGRGTVIVSGTGSSWDTSGAPSVAVGFDGAGSLLVTSGASFTAQQIYFGRNPAAIGNGTVSGASSLLTTPILQLGESGIGSLSISAGAQLATEQLQIGAQSGSRGLLTISGSGTRWDHGQSQIYVGKNGAGTITISNNASVTFGSGLSGLTLGDASSANGNITVGTGANCSGQDEVVLIGNSGHGRLSVDSGGKVQISQFALGSLPNGYGELASRGSGSEFKAILNGAQPFQAPNIVGGAGDALLEVTDSSVARIDGALVVGRDISATGTVRVSNAATVTITTNDPANIISNQIALNGNGNMEITGGAVLNLNGNLSVGGRQGAFGSMLIDGAGSSAAITHDLYVGYVNGGGEIGHGAVTITNGGVLSANHIYISTGGAITAGAGAISGGLVNAGSMIFGSSMFPSLPMFGPPSSASEHFAIGSLSNTGTINIARSAVVTISGGLNNSGTIDLSGAMIIDYTGDTSFNVIRDQILSGYAGGAWNGPGIKSTLAASSGNRRTVAIVEAASIFNAFPANYFDQAIDATTVLVKNVYFGDANLDGFANALDFNTLATNYGLTARSWSSGDFNGDGTANSLDFDSLAINFNTSQDAGFSSTVLPEPQLLIASLILVPTAGRSRRVWKRDVVVRSR